MGGWTRSRSTREHIVTTQYRPTEPVLDRLLIALQDLRDGNFQTRVSADEMPVELAATVNEIAARNERLVTELARVRATVGRDGRLDDRLSAGPSGGFAEA